MGREERDGHCTDLSSVELSQTDGNLLHELPLRVCGRGSLSTGEGEATQYSERLVCSLPALRTP